MYRHLAACATVLLALTSGAAPAETPSQGAPDDTRQLVSMPDEARQLMREDMLDHLSAVSEIIGLLAAGNLASAADVAEKRMGRSSMGKHRGTGMGPGRYMPQEMRSIGWGMHEAASDLADAARDGDAAGAQAALQQVTSACVACHYGFRTR